MIDRTQLLSDLQTLVRQLENDLQERINSPEVPEVGERLKAEYQKAKKAERTAQTFNQWVSDYKIQVAVAWVLSATFARFLEDNGLVSPPRLSGPGDNLQRARDEHEIYFREHPTETDREYLLWMFQQLARLPGAQEIFGEGNLIWDLPNWLSGDAAGDILKQFQAIDPNTGDLVHDFTDPEWDTRFLGDLYQDLSEAARKKYALLQTPIFVEEFILDRTLEPAVEEFGLSDFRMIDPACGSGHFLLGSFHRLLDRWLRKEPGTNVEELARRALESVHGVDVNPFAVAIARFRLLLAAMKATNQKALKNARDFPLNLACGDSLIHGDWHQIAIEGVDPETHTYSIEDIQVLMGILVPGHYHAVVANPPYIVPKDKKLNAKYRHRYETCHRQYSLAVPFMERIFQLAVPGGFTGQITANSFMKREFGKKLIEAFFPKVDLTHVIDTSGAYIPGHGTPTVILFGRNRKPINSKIRTVMGIRGEPSTPKDPTKGLVWSAILDQVDVAGSESEFVSVANSQRDLFHKHPWSIGGGGASELKESIVKSAKSRLREFIAEIGRTTHSGEDEVFYLSQSGIKTNSFTRESVPLISGETVRDYQLDFNLVTIFPYNQQSGQVFDSFSDKLSKHFWKYRINLKSRRDFGQTVEERGLKWFEHSMFFPHRFINPLSISFPFVSTHNHFVLDRGGKVFKQTAPAIKLPVGATEDDHLFLLGLLNSSTACFWMKQVFYPKATSTGDISTEKGKPEANRYEFAGTGLENFPIPLNPKSPEAKLILQIATNLDSLARQLISFRPESVIQNWQGSKPANLRSLLSSAHKKHQISQERMICLQEELDWEVYKAFRLVDEGASLSILDNTELGIVSDHRPFLWAKKEAPADLAETLRDLYEKRYRIIQENKQIRLIEDLVFKRPWWGRQGSASHLCKTHFENCPLR
jgi:hypothetical protein